MVCENATLDCYSGGMKSHMDCYCGNKCKSHINMLVIGEFDGDVAAKWPQWTTISKKRNSKGSKVFVKRLNRKCKLLLEN